MSVTDNLIVALVVLGALLCAALAALVASLVARRIADGDRLGAPLQGFVQTLGELRAGMQNLTVRIAAIEREQGQVGQSLALLDSKLGAADMVAQGLTQTASAIRSELAHTQASLSALQALAKARQDLEQRTAQSIQRLEAIIAGTQSKGAAGENIMEVVLAQLPPEWQVRNFQVGNKTVEFGLRLPNNLVLPIDSKWAGTHLLEQFVNCEDPERRQQLKAQIERAVLAKAKEVRRYLDPNVTLSFGIAAVPDAVLDLCSAAQVEALQQGVVLVSYSMFLPYVLLVFQMVLRTSQSIDLDKLHAYLESAQTELKAMQEEVEGRFSRALTMLDNSRNDMRAHLGKAASSLTALQLGAGSREEAADLSFHPSSTLVAPPQADGRGDIA